jgi:hypothetical protein
LLFRTNADLSKELVSFNLAALLAATEKDIELKKDDSVSIVSAKDFAEMYVNCRWRSSTQVCTNILKALH